MGERFGDYEIEGRLGAGGMAEVYVARRAGPEGFVKRVCLKRVLAESESNRDLVAQFHDEARLCAHLLHPAIATVHELGQVDGKWFMSMELVDGMDLRSLALSLRGRGATLPHDIVFYVVRMLGEALAYAHALTIDGKPTGLVHRDVTPSNVLLSVHGEVKLADFGIARSTTQTHRTRTGVVKGKVPYMPPEQALGEPLDRRTDLFALGVVLYELIAGRRPHDGPTDLDTLTNAQRGRRTPLRELAPELPAEVSTLVGRLLASRPDDRPASADEVVRVLGALPTARDPRRALALLVEDARRMRQGAPSTRVRGRRAMVNVDRAAPVDDGPTEIGGERPTAATASEARSSSMIQRAIGPNRALQFAVGFSITLVLGALAFGALALVLGGDRITQALAEPPVPVASATPVDPPKPPVAVVAPPPVVVPPIAAAPVAPVLVEAPPAPAARHRRSHAHVPVADDASPSFGRIQVVVVPFGDVTLDDRPLGRAPLTTTVEAGRHVVVVSNGGAHVERRVTVEPGGTQRIVVDLVEME